MNSSVRHLFVLQLVWKHFPVTFEKFTVIFVVVPVYTYSVRSQRSHRRLLLIKDHIPALILTTASGVPSLKQTAAVLQSSVVGFCWSCSSVHSISRLSQRSSASFAFFFLLFLDRDQWKAFYVCWCWMSKGGSRRSRNILLESHFERASHLVSSFVMEV